MPAYVYLLPLVVFFSIGVATALIATVIFALPPLVRLTSYGIRGVPASSLEVGTAFGATTKQVLRKIQVPLARPSIMLGVNQGIIMVLAVVVIGGLVGSGGLGYLVAQGLVRGEFGLGVVASLAILALGIALDRVTQATRRDQRGAIA